MQSIQEMATDYANRKVESSPKNDFKKYPFRTQKELTTFDGYEIEQAYEDGANMVLELVENFVKDLNTLKNVLKERD